MTRPLYIGWAGRAATLLTALTAVLPSAAQDAPPTLAIRRVADGVYRLEVPADIGPLAFEQAESLEPPVKWSPAVTGPDGAVTPVGGTRFYRWRRIEQPGVAVQQIVPFEFVDPPIEVRPGERVMFGWSGIPLDPRAVRWRVVDVVGLGGPLGEISPEGEYTAPAKGMRQRVAVVAEAALGAGRVARAQAEFVVQATEPTRGPQRLVPGIGGTVVGLDGRGRLEVPPDAVDSEQRWSIDALGAGWLSEVDEPGRVALAVAELKPEGIVFSRPVRVSFPLDRWRPAGGNLRLYVGRWELGSRAWEDSGFAATVESDGFTATAELPHFSTWAALEPRNTDPATTVAPRIDTMVPLAMREGELRPFLLKGTGFESVTRVTVHEDSPAGPFGSSQVEVKEFAATPGEFAVLLKSHPDPTLPAGVPRRFRLRLSVNPGVASEVPLIVTGLDEFIVSRGGAAEVTADPATNRVTFSRIEIQAGARLESRARVLAWQATDSVLIVGTVTAAGPAGPAARQGDPGRMAEPDRTRTGAGDGQRASPWTPLDGTRPNGIPRRTVNLADYLPGSLAHTFGEPGGIGFDGGSSRAVEVLPAVDEAMYALFGRRVNDGVDSVDPFGLGYGRVVAQELTEAHPGGRKGHQGMPGGFLARAPMNGFHPVPRRIEAGGGGGGGGGSYRAAAFVDGDVVAVGLGGGAGGGGGGAISLVAGGTLVIEAGARIDSSGGAGGDGGLPATLGTPPDLWAQLGRGGGGGPGGAGTVHLRAGERLENPSQDWPIWHRAGPWGQGGFLMRVQSHRQVTPHSWLAPVEELAGSAQAELAGPDFTSSGTGLRTGIRLARAVHAHALNPRFQAVSVRVLNRAGVHVYPLRGVSSATRDVRFLLAPGTNLVQLSDLADHAVLDREIVVLDSPDMDGDGLTDAEEVGMGFDPTSADTDGDGMPDATEWLNGGQGVPGDSDGDGVPDATEREVGSDPEDPSSTPWNANLGSGNALAMVAAQPSGLRLVRPAFDGLQALGPGVTVAGPVGLKVVRPAAPGVGDPPWGTVRGVPHVIRVVRE